MIKTHWIFALLLGTCLCGDLSAQVAQPSKYRGWDTLSLSNGLLELQVAPAIGGRVIQVTLDGYEYLFVNDELAGCSPPPTGVGPNGEWLNYGGEKLWPAPQGHGIPGKWDGPPDPVLDGSPHAGTIVQAKGDSAAVRLVSRDDPRSGIRFSREIQLFADSTRVHVEATMTNVDTQPRRWGIWSVMQHNSASRLGPGYDRNMRVYCPLRKDSIYPNGFHISHGPADHSSFQLDDTGKLLVTHYERKMGKIRADSDAGWIATVHGSAGYVLAQRFQYHPEKEYPDEASVEIWLHGPYGPKAAQTDPKTFPYFLESELLSPFAQLAPGESYTFDCDWYAGRHRRRLPDPRLHGGRRGMRTVHGRCRKGPVETDRAVRCLLSRKCPTRLPRCRRQDARSGNTQTCRVAPRTTDPHRHRSLSARRDSHCGLDRRRCLGQKLRSTCNHNRNQ